MPPAKPTYDLPTDGPNAVLKEDGIESGLLGKLQGLKYEYRPDTTNRATLKNFREKFEALSRVRLADAEFARLLDEIVTPDVFTASKTLRSINKTSSEEVARSVSACSANQFNKFQEGCVEENTNTDALVRRLLSEDDADRLIVTSIKKLGLPPRRNHQAQQAAKEERPVLYLSAAL